MKHFQKLLSGFMLGAAFSPVVAAEEDRPNILVIMVDQMRADLCGREGFPLNTTPFLDETATQGCWFDKAYTTSPASVPARTSFLTGRFPKATRVRSNHNLQDAVYEQDIYDVMRKAGYRTAMVGKNHSYLTAQKTDYWQEYGHTGKIGDKSLTEEQQAYDNYLKTLRMYVDYDPSPFGVEQQLPYRMVDEALDWISTEDDRPFFMWFSIPEPHTPYQACEPYYSLFPSESLPTVAADITTLSQLRLQYTEMYDAMIQAHPDYPEKIDRIRSVYYGMLRMIDDQVKRLIDSLKEQGVFENTMIVFLSDHGDYVGEYGLIKKGVGVSDILSRIPMIWHGPGIQADPNASAAHISIVDIFPTLCEIVGEEIPQGVQGRSLWELLQGKPYPAEEFASVMGEQGYGGGFYTSADGADYEGEGCLNVQRGSYDSLNSWTQSGSLRLLRKGDWKLVYDMQGNGELYHIATDPSEVNNLFDRKEYDQVKMELLQHLLKWEIATQDPLPVPRKRYHFKRNQHNYIFK